MSLHFIRAYVLGFVGPTHSFQHSDNMKLFDNISIVHTYVFSEYSHARVYYNLLINICAERVASFNFHMGISRLIYFVRAGSKIRI